MTRNDLHTGDWIHSLDSRHFSRFGICRSICISTSLKTTFLVLTICLHKFHGIGVRDLAQIYLVEDFVLFVC